MTSLLPGTAFPGIDLPRVGGALPTWSFRVDDLPIIPAEVEPPPRNPAGASGIRIRLGAGLAMLISQFIRSAKIDGERALRQGAAGHRLLQRGVQLVLQPGVAPAHRQ